MAQAKIDEKTKLILELRSKFPTMSDATLERTLKAEGLITNNKNHLPSTNIPESIPEKEPKASKYHNEKTELDGITFDSKAEANRYAELILLKKGNEISNLEIQKRFVLIPKSQYGRDLCYFADFAYYDKTGNYVVEDVKSKITITPVYKLKRRLMAEKFDIIITEVAK